MKVPLSAKMSMSMMYYSSPLRPKHFVVLAIESKSGDIKIERYVRSWPFALRIRLFLAKQKLIWAYLKVVAFKNNHGI